MDTAFVRELVRTRDRERYWSSLYAPADRRDDLLAIQAFDVEIAGIRDRVHEPLPGEIRLQWWRDAIAAGEGAGNPLAEALLAAIRRHNLPTQAFLTYLDARIFDLYNDAMPSRADLEGYLGETQSSLLQLSAMILDRAAAPAVSDLAGRAGCAQGVLDILRGLPIHSARGQCFTPLDILASVGASVDDIGKGGEGAGRAVAAMIALARDHLSAFEARAHELPPTLRPAFLPVALTRVYLDRLSRPGADPLRELSDLADWRKQLVLLRRAMRGWPPARPAQ